MNKSVLIVYVHPEPTSFNAALKDKAVEILKKQGYSVEVTDLYASNFNPLISRNDIKGDLAKPEHFSYPHEAGEAYKRGELADDIIAEQKKVKDADLVIFQFPINWGGMPAMMKGWYSRVMLPNFAYDFPNMFDNGFMKGKKALVSITAGAPEVFYTNRGFLGDINVYLWPIQHCMLRYCGFDVLAPHICYAPSMMGDDGRKKNLKSWEDRLPGIFSETPLYFVPTSEFKPIDPSNPYAGMALADTEGPQGLTVGQNLGKAYPPDGMTKGKQ